MHVLGRQLEVAQLLAGLDVKDVEDELQGVSRALGLHATEGDQELLAGAELDALHLYWQGRRFEGTEMDQEGAAVLLAQ